MLRVENLSKSFGGVAAMSDVTLDFPAGSLTAVIGPNGAGKTTFFNLISGAIRPDSGKVLLEGRDVAGLPATQVVGLGIGRAFQVAKLFTSLTVEQSLIGALQAQRHQSGHLWRRFPLPDYRGSAQEVMELLGLHTQAGVQSGNLSHGDQKLLDIALALVLKPKVLLLDEPTAGMGPEERWKMIDTVHRLWTLGGLTLIFIEHDMDIVFKIAQSIRVLCYGKVLAQGSPDEIRDHPAVIEAYLGVPAESVDAHGADGSSVPSGGAR
ncbi:MAG: ABC transporter ATP-binding protein [Burkholderiaceae bacterium]|nr:ABC transporter ATP-binding protein [Burkholderiaceae bacterium]MBP8309546.1 ABC transporter ATP-binding protein [Burkholderiaceae bacterium]